MLLLLEELLESRLTVHVPCCPTRVAPVHLDCHSPGFIQGPVHLRSSGPRCLSRPCAIQDEHRDGARHIGGVGQASMDSRNPDGAPTPTTRRAASPTIEHRPEKYDAWRLTFWRTANAKNIAHPQHTHARSTTTTKDAATHCRGKTDTTLRKACK